MSTSTLARPRKTSRAISTRSCTVNSGDLSDVDQNRDDDLIEEARPALDDVHVTHRQRVERAGIDGDDRRHRVVRSDVEGRMLLVSLSRVSSRSSNTK